MNHDKDEHFIFLFTNKSTFLEDQSSLTLA